LCSTEQDLIDVLKSIESNSYIVIGDGSNILAPDSDYAGTVIHNKFSSIKRFDNTIIVGTGTNLDDFVKYCVINNFAGFSKLSGIPGTIGGALFYNSGAFGAEISDLLLTVVVWDIKSQSIMTLNKKDLNFSYRSSNLQTNSNFVALSAVFEVLEQDTEVVEYENLRNTLNDNFGNNNIGNNYTLQDTRAAVLQLRNKSDTLVTQTGETINANRVSLGSFFKNPTVDYPPSLRVDARQSQYQKPPKIRTYPNSDRTVKLSASDLIAATGITKGYKYSDSVGVSTTNNLVICNLGGATTTEILEFAQLIQKKVFDQFEVQLNIEPTLLE
jgi:UDP-N-acetylmuramate dehydrogenase